MILALAMIASLMVTTTIVISEPAAADGGPIYAFEGRGSARFKSYGDHIFLCDHGWDGNSVAVKLVYVHETKATSSTGAGTGGGRSNTTVART